MVEDNIKVINHFDIQIKDLEEDIKKVNMENNEIKLSIQKKLLILQRLDALLSDQED